MNGEWRSRFCYGTGAGALALVLLVGCGRPAYGPADGAPNGDLDGEKPGDSDDSGGGGGGSGDTGGSGGTGGDGGFAGSGGSGGAGGEGGTTGAAGSGGAGIPASCVGLPETCGPSRDDDCCTSLLVPGGTYNRSNDPKYPATVSDFRLDKYEITVGRFRAFMNSGNGTLANPPAEGDGAHPLIPGSGWNSEWTRSYLYLAADTAAWLREKAYECGRRPYFTWTKEAGAMENRPMNCMTWIEAFAFCAWDGGRLPTEAEWNYVAAGGGEQREYPWGDAAADDSYAVYCGGSCDSTQDVGSKSPKGDGKWGHADLAGNMWEATLDFPQGLESYMMPCTNCASVRDYCAGGVRGGSFFSREASALRSSTRMMRYSSNLRDGWLGARCARSP